MSKATWWEKLGLYLIAAVMVGWFVLLIWYGVWSLWVWALPQLWPSGPELLVHPSYWQFAGLWVLLAFVGRLFRGGSQ